MKASNDKKQKHKNINIRDQGLVRPKVLFLVPFRESARCIVELMEKLVFNKTKEKSSGNVNINQKRNMNSNVAHRKRFQDEYGSEEQFEPEKAGRKPPDY